MHNCTAGAEHVAELLQHSARLARPGAGRNLIAALDQAAAQIERSPGAGLQAPRPYPFLAQLGRLWIKAGRYWIAYSITDPPVILARFHDAANIPERLLPSIIIRHHLPGSCSMTGAR